MTRGFQLLIPLLVVMLSISVMNAILLQTTGRIVPELISEAVRAAGAGVRHADGGDYLFIYL